MKKAFTLALVVSCLALRLSPSSLAQDKTSRTPVSVASEGGSREQDKLKGPVRRVRVETAKVILKDGHWVEGPRELLGIATYDPSGRKIDFVNYPLEGTPPAKEHYVYDDKGNVVEMTLRNTEGSLLSKESYKYEFDQLGNWTKKSSSVAIYENGKIGFEPTGITYRTISYYYSQAIEKFNSPPQRPNGNSVTSTSANLTDSNRSSTESPGSSTPNITPAGTALQPRSEAGNGQANKELVSAAAAVVPDKSGSAGSESPVGTSSELRSSPVDTAAKTVVQHVSEDVLRSSAIELPKPEYSEAALLARASGRVKVQVLVDENGQVTNAQATSGHPLLGASAEAAARKARFSLPKLSGGATRVYGVISYDFVPPPSAGETSAAPLPATDTNRSKSVDRKREAGTDRTGVVESKPKPSADHSEAARPFYDKGVKLQAQGRFSEAAEAFHQAIKLNPNDAGPYVRLGMAYSAMLKHKDAIPVYKMAVQINKSVLDAAAYYMWGHSYLALDKSSDALKAFKQALYITKAQTVDLEPNATQPYPSLEQVQYGMGIAYLNSKRFSDSIDELKKVVALNPKNAEAHYALAIAYLSNGNRRAAENQEQTLRSLDSSLAEKIVTALAIRTLPPGCRTIACR